MPRSSTGAAFGGGAEQKTGDSVAEEGNEHDQQNAVGKQLELLRVAQQLRQRYQQDRADYRAQRMAKAADDIGPQNVDRDGEGGRGGRQEADEMCVDAAGDAGHEAAQPEDPHAPAHDVDAEGTGEIFVLLDRVHGPSGARAIEQPGYRESQRE